MTHVFISRAELLPAGESTDDHRKSQEEEAAVVDNHKSSNDPKIGGLFRGTFKHKRTPGSFIYDSEDEVERCPMCTWELEDGFCNACQTRYDSEAELQSGSDLDHTESDTFTDVVAAANRGVVREGDYLGSFSDEDDISLDGDGQSLHAHNTATPHGNFTFGRSAAQGLIGRPIGRPSRQRTSSPAPLRNRRRYAPSTLSDVATTNEDDAFSQLDADLEDDSDSLDGFLVNDDTTSEDELENGIEEELENAMENGTEEELENARENRIEEELENEMEAMLRGCVCAHHSGASEEDEGMAEYQTNPSSPGSPSPDEDANESSMDDDNNSDSSNSITRVGPHPESSDSEPAIIPQRSRKRRRIVPDVSSDDNDDDGTSEQGSQRSRPRRRISSSGSTTVGRHSPALEPIPHAARRRRRAQIPPSPIVIQSSSVEPESPRPRRQFNHRRRVRRALSDTSSEHNPENPTNMSDVVGHALPQNYQVRRPQPVLPRSRQYSPELQAMDVTINSCPTYGYGSRSQPIYELRIDFANRGQGYGYRNSSTRLA